MFDDPKDGNGEEEAADETSEESTEETAEQPFKLNL